MDKSEPVDRRDTAPSSTGTWLLVAGVALVVVGLVGLAAPGPGLLLLVPGVVLAAAGLAVRLLARRADPASKDR